MPSTMTLPLPKAINDRAASFFGCEFDRVSVHLNHRPRQLGALAFTDGEDIWLDPMVACLPESLGWQVFGHELTHIVQQRQGRVGLDPSNGTRVLDEASLEAEADRQAMRFAHGGRSEFRGTDASAGCPGILQYLVAVEGQRIGELTDLPQSIQMVTGMIQGGTDWLQWAAKEPATVFDFPDWLGLVDGIQWGLHGNGLILIESLGLLINPIALLSIPDVGIAALQTYLTSGNANSVADLEMEKVLRQNRYLTQSQLGAVGDFLNQVGLVDNPLFQAMSLGEQIAVYQAINQVPGDWALQPDNQSEAARYAADYAASPQAFGDFYDFYINHFAIPDLADLSPDRRARLARTRSDEIAASLRNDMRCPSVVGTPVPEKFQNEMRAWFSAGNGLGFPSVSRGVMSVADLKKAEGLNGQALQRQIDKYLDRAKAIVNHAKPDPQPYVAQDGSAFFYRFGSGGTQAELQLECASGAVTLAQCTDDGKTLFTNDGPIGEASLKPKTTT